MTWKTETTVQNLLDIGGRLRNFLCGYRLNADPVFTGVGSGTMDGFGCDGSLVDQNWTITCTDATTPGAEVWSVVGSVTGALASATSNVLYDVSGIQFIISSNPAGAFAVADFFQVVVAGQGQMAASLEAGTLKQHSYSYAGTALSHYDFQVEMAGNGVTPIQLGFVCKRDIDSNRFLVELYGGSVFNGALGVHQQPGASSKTVVYTRNQPMTHWMVGSDAGLIWVIQAGTTFRLAYCKLMTPGASPNQYPFPLVIGGESDDALGTFTYSTIDSRVRFPVDPAWNALKVMAPGGTWEVVNNYANLSTESFVSNNETVGRTYPYGFTSYVRASMNAIRPNLEEKYLLWPIMITRGVPQETYGTFDGIMAVSGFNTLTAGDIVQESGIDYLIVQNVHRNNNYDHCAVRLT